MNKDTLDRTPGHAAAGVATGGKYLTFRLASEDYAFEILKVQEIIKLLEITRVPRTPPFVKGVINLRGKVIPIVDLRLKFNMEAHDPTNKTCIIVVQVARGDSKVVMGTIVDEVSEVLDIADSQIEAAPLLGSDVDTHFILGMAKVKDRVKILLDVDRVLSTDEIINVATVGK